MTDHYLQDFTLHIHRIESHLLTAKITVSPIPGGWWKLTVDDRLEIWSETYSTASAAMMRAATLIRCYEVGGGTFVSDAQEFEDVAEEFLQGEVG